MEKNVQALLLTPYDESYECVRHAIERPLTRAGIKLVTTYDLQMEPGELVVDAVSDAIRTSELILADVSKLNVNVSYELGFAYALRKTTVLIVSAEAAKDIPFSLAGYPVVYYEPDNLTGLSTGLLRFIKAQASRVLGAGAGV